MFLLVKVEKSLKFSENRVKCLAACLLRTPGASACSVEAAGECWVGESSQLKNIGTGRHVEMPRPGPARRSGEIQGLW